MIMDWQFFDIRVGRANRLQFIVASVLTTMILSAAYFLYAYTNIYLAIIPGTLAICLFVPVALRRCYDIGINTPRRIIVNTIFFFAFCLIFYARDGYEAILFMVFILSIHAGDFDENKHGFPPVGYNPFKFRFNIPKTEKDPHEEKQTTEAIGFKGRKL